MIVCVCHAKSDRDIQEMIDAGCDDLRSLARACRAGTDCGCCVAELRRIVGERRDLKAISGLAAPLQAK